MQKTTNLQLNKPDYSDKADIADLNKNMDILDEEVFNKSDLGHKHKKSDITDFPASLPANGGNADTIMNP